MQIVICFTRTVLDIYDKISSENKIPYLMGGFNNNLLYLCNPSTKLIFIDSVIAQGCIPHITKPTRITSTTATPIDHVCSNHTHTIYNSEIIVTDMTGHFGIFHLEYGTPPMHKVEYKQTRQLNKSNILTFRNILEQSKIIAQYCGICYWSK